MMMGQVVVDDDDDEDGGGCEGSVASVSTSSSLSRLGGQGQGQGQGQGGGSLLSSSPSFSCSESSVTHPSVKHQEEEEEEYDDDDIPTMEPNVLISRYLLSNRIGIKSDWRTRDSIYSLLYNRHYHCTMSNTNSNNTNNSNKRDGVVLLSLSSLDDHDSVVDDALERARNHRDKCQAIVRSFYAAATSLLLGLQRQQDYDLKKKTQTSSSFSSNHHHQHEDEDDEDESFLNIAARSLSSSSDHNNKSQQKHLYFPIMNQIFQDISQTKEETFYTILQETSSSSSSSKHKSSTNKNNNNGNSSLTNDNNNNNKNNNNKRSLSSDTNNNNNKGNKKSKGNNNNNDGSTSCSTLTNSNSSRGSSLIAGGPAANIDSRATVSRAILCAAASVTFSKLTPHTYCYISNQNNHNNLNLGDTKLDVLNVPQNTHYQHNNNNDNNDSSTTNNNNGGKDDRPIINMGAVMMQANIFGKRAMEQALGAARRSDHRQKWRLDCCHYQYLRPKLLNAAAVPNNTSKTNLLPFLNLPNPYAIQPSSHPSTSSTTTKSMRSSSLISDDSEEDTEDGDNNNNNNISDDDDDDDRTEEYEDSDDNDNDNDEDEESYLYKYRSYSTTSMMSNHSHSHSHDDMMMMMGGVTREEEEEEEEEWTQRCRPHLLQILQTGAGHAVLLDYQWSTRMHRISNLLSFLPNNNKGGHGGPHLIITTHMDLQDFASVFSPSQHIPSTHHHNHNYSNSNNNNNSRLRVLVYGDENVKRRRMVRKEHFPLLRQGAGVIDMPHHVLLTTYKIFLQDYVHICQIPFQVVMLDDGMSWLGTAHYDPNGQLGKVWEMGMFAKSDGHAGMAGSTTLHPTTTTTNNSNNNNNNDDPTDWDFSIDPTKLYIQATTKKTKSSTNNNNNNNNTTTTNDESSSSSKNKKNSSKSSSSTKSTNNNSKSSNNNNLNGVIGSCSPLIGLTARHKIIIASRMHCQYRDVTYVAPVPALLSFILPQFADVVKEEWDRSRIHNCQESMTHVRKLLTRSIVVYTGIQHQLQLQQQQQHSNHNNNNMLLDSSALTLAAMQGQIQQSSNLSQYIITNTNHNNKKERNDSVSSSSSEMEDHHHHHLLVSSSSSSFHTISIPAYTNTNNKAGLLLSNNNNNNNNNNKEISTDLLIADGKIVQSRRFAASWLHNDSPIRYELGTCSLQAVLSAIQVKALSGHVCEEVVTASSITSSGAGGAVTGPSAYGMAIRCGRTFGSEQGLRQHMAALHAPPGTWLCRSCGQDCGTSQARTHHERYCGQIHQSGGTGGGSGGSSGPSNNTNNNNNNNNSSNSSGGGIPTVGQGIGSSNHKHHHHHSMSNNNNKSNKKNHHHHHKNNKNAADKDGSIRVPGYRGVWVNPTGKHFIKVNDQPLTLQDKQQHETNIKQEEQDNTTTTNTTNNNNNNSEKRWLFDAAEDAARIHDAFVHKKGMKGDVEMNFKPNGTRIVYEDAAAAAAAGRGLEMLGGGASSVVPALSVINIKDLPKGVKPLLRDPRQTSRTGGNSKRYVYAYRGVCRQARKGHDRWQSQISFGGTNHYLGTFDSEWDAAAIYAWAHLILYGEEATKKAQKEGEEAVAAHEQEKKDIAAGKIITPPPKASKKKKRSTTTATTDTTTNNNNKSNNNNNNNNTTTTKNPTKSSTDKTNKKQDDTNNNNNNTTGKFVGIPKVSVLCPPPPSSSVPFSENDLIWGSSQRILSTRNHRCQGLLKPTVAVTATTTTTTTTTKSGGGGSMMDVSVCVPVDDNASQLPQGYGMLVGLVASDFGWNMQDFLTSWESYSLVSPKEEQIRALQSEYGADGYNLLFRSIIQGLPCFIGRAGKDLEKASAAIGLHGAELGGTVGNVDCNVGGVDGSCSEIAARITVSSSSNTTTTFQFSATNETDIVTINGERITSSMGNFPIKNEDICSVGSRVFMFLSPSESNS